MKILIFLSFVACNGVAAKRTKEQLVEITDRLDKLSFGQQDLIQKIESIEDKMGDIASKGNWYLGMNINPADGHTFGYTVGTIV